MTSQVKLPTAEGLQLREVKKGVWAAATSDSREAYDYFEVPLVFKLQRDTVDKSDALATQSLG